MAIFTDDYIAELVWLGDYRAVQMARDAYQEHSYGNLLMLACTLYSFRAHYECRYDLVKLIPKLMLGAQALIASFERGFTEEKADQADVLSTILLWYTRQPESVKDEDAYSYRVYVLDMATAVAEAALQEPCTQNPHTEALLCTTLVTLRYDHRTARRQYLLRAERLVPHINYPRQKKKVLKRLATIQLGRLNPKGLVHLGRALAK